MCHPLNVCCWNRGNTVLDLWLRRWPSIVLLVHIIIHHEEILINSSISVLVFEIKIGLEWKSESVWVNG